MTIMSDKQLKLQKLFKTKRCKNSIHFTRYRNIKNKSNFIRDGLDPSAETRMPK